MDTWTHRFEKVRSKPSHCKWFWHAIQAQPLSVKRRGIVYTRVSRMVNLPKLWNYTYSVTILFRRIGYCVMTVGTDNKTGIQWDGVDLLSAHDYAIMGELSHCTSPINIWDDSKIYTKLMGSGSLRFKTPNWTIQRDTQYIMDTVRYLRHT